MLMDVIIGRLGATIQVVTCGHNQPVLGMFLGASWPEIEKQEGYQADDHHACEKAEKDFDGESWIRDNFDRFIRLKIEKNIIFY